MTFAAVSQEFEAAPTPSTQTLSNLSTGPVANKAAFRLLPADNLGGCSHNFPDFQGQKTLGCRENPLFFIKNRRNFMVFHDSPIWGKNGKLSENPAKLCAGIISNLAPLRPRAPWCCPPSTLRFANGQRRLRTCSSSANAWIAEEKTREAFARLCLYTSLL